MLRAFGTFAKSVVPTGARGATVFVAAFPVLNETEWRTVDVQYFEHKHLSCLCVGLSSLRGVCIS